MEQPNDHSNYTCSCQQCGGHIKFESNQLRKGETRTVECPHCHLDTILFVREKADEPPKALLAQTAAHQERPLAVLHRGLNGAAAALAAPGHGHEAIS